MSDELQMLAEMGFSRERAQRALDVTGNKGVESAMEWLLAHSEADIAADSTGQSVDVPTTAAVDDASTSGGDAGSSDAVGEVKSFKCEECNRLFTNQTEVEFHAAKSGHSNFSESTEEKPAMTDEQKKAQLVLLEQKLKMKRMQREETEKAEAREREKMRIRSGKDLSEAQRKIEEQEMKKLCDERRRQKQDDKKARERVLAQIEADKAARREQMALLTGKPVTSPTNPTPTQPPPQSVTSSTTTATSPKNVYTNTRIQVRLLNGSTLVETFDVKEQLSAVRLFVQMKQGQGIVEPFGLMTNFPRKVFTEQDFETPLEQLGLVPSAVLIVTKSSK